MPAVEKTPSAKRPMLEMTSSMKKRRPGKRGAAIVPTEQSPKRSPAVPRSLAKMPAVEKTPSAKRPVLEMTSSMEKRRPGERGAAIFPTDVFFTAVHLPAVVNSFMLTGDLRSLMCRAVVDVKYLPCSQDSCPDALHQCMKRNNETMFLMCDPCHRQCISRSEENISSHNSLK